MVRRSRLMVAHGLTRMRVDQRYGLHRSPLEQIREIREIRGIIHSLCADVRTATVRASRSVKSVKSAACPPYGMCFHSLLETDD
jgi:hypothetical protein